MFRSSVKNAAATAAVAVVAGGALVAGSGVAIAAEPHTRASFAPAHHPDRHCDPETIRREIHRVDADDHERVRQIMRERGCPDIG